MLNVAPDARTIIVFASSLTAPARPGVPCANPLSASNTSSAWSESTA
jgi:hypothetical protein